MNKFREMANWFISVIFVLCIRYWKLMNQLTIIPAKSYKLLKNFQIWTYVSFSKNQCWHDDVVYLARRTNDDFVLFGELKTTYSWYYSHFIMWTIFRRRQGMISCSLRWISSCTQIKFEVQCTTLEKKSFVWLSLLKPKR